MTCDTPEGRIATLPRHLRRRAGEELEFPTESPSLHRATTFQNVGYAANKIKVVLLGAGREAILRSN
jgi:hypothetical protein